MTAHLHTNAPSTRSSPAPADGLAADRERIAAGLTDSVIHSMFSASLNLHGALALDTCDQIHDRIRDAIDELDRAITIVRTTVFDLAGPTALDSPSATAETLVWSGPAI